MRRRPLAGERPDPGEDSMGGGVREEPAGPWHPGAARAVCVSSPSVFADTVLEVGGLRGSIHRLAI